VSRGRKEELRDSKRLSLVRAAMRLSLVVLALSGIVLCQTESGVKKHTNNATDEDVSLLDLGRGRKAKKNKRRQTPEAKWNALMQTMDGFLKKNLGDRHKKVKNHLNRIRNMAGPAFKKPGQRTPNCLKVTESKSYLRKLRAEKRKKNIADKREQRLEEQKRRKEARLAKQLFEDDIVEGESAMRRRRADEIVDEEGDGRIVVDEGDEYYDYALYPELILTPEEIEMYEFEFLSEYPDYAYLDDDEDADGMEDSSGAEVVRQQGLAQARARRGKRGKKKSSGGKIGPKRVWFNLVTAAKGMINAELKGCADKKTFVKRIGLFAERVKKNAPILTAPVKKCRGRKCRKQNG